MSYTNGIFAAHAKQVIEDDIEGTPANTIVTYERKTKDFIMYCEKIHPTSSSGISSTTVTEEKFFGFLFYQSRRSVKGKGRPKNVSEIPVF